MTAGVGTVNVGAQPPPRHEGANMHPKRILVTFVLLALASWISLAHAADIPVPSAYSTIDSALAVATSGQDNIVIVSEGTYPPFTLNKAVPVTNSSSGEVVIDGSSSSWAAQVTNAGGSIQGLTLLTGSTGGVALGGATMEECQIVDDGNPFTGYAITLDGGTVHGCVITLTSGHARAIDDNFANHTGGSTISNNTIVANITSNGVSENRAIQAIGDDLHITGNQITLTGSDLGIPVWCSTVGTPDITENIIDGGWIGIYLQDVFDGAVSENIVTNATDACIVIEGGDGIDFIRNTLIGRGCHTTGSGILIPSDYGTMDESLFENNLIINVDFGLDFITYLDQNWVLHHNAFASGTADCGDVSQQTLSTQQIETIDYPLFCEGREGSMEYTHRIDSSAAPGNNGFDEIVGVYGVECAWGTLSGDATLRTGETVTVLEDLTIPSGLELSLDDGSTLLFDDDDNSGSGRDTTKNELVVEGRFSALGYSFDTALTSAKASPAAGDWYGIVVKPGADVVLNDVKIEHPQYGLRDDAGAATADIYMEGVDVSSFVTAGVYLVPDPHADGTGTLTMTDCSLDMSGALYGVYLLNSNAYDGYDVVMTVGQIQGNSSGTYGLYLNMTGANGDVEVTNLEVDDLTTGTGIYVHHQSPIIRGPIIDNCNWGMQLEGYGSPAVQWSTHGAGVLSNCTVGLYAKGSCTVDVDSLVIEDCTTGLYTDEYSLGAYVDVDISGGTTGCKAKSSNPHTFREGNITGFGSFGVDALPTTGMDFGTANDHGSNNIYSTVQGVTKFFRVKPLVEEIDDIPARWNYWGSNPPNASMFSAKVDYSSYLTSVISLSMPGTGMGELPRQAMLSALPNPSRSRAALQFVLPKDGAAYTLGLYDVRGRLVCEWTGEAAGGRLVEVRWDGSDDQGASAPAGIYFVRLRSAGETFTQRLVRIGS